MKNEKIIATSISLAFFFLLAVVVKAEVVRTEKICSSEGFCIEVERVEGALDIIWFNIRKFLRLMIVSPNPATPGSTVTNVDGKTINCRDCFTTSQVSYWVCRWRDPRGNVVGSSPVVTSCCDCSVYIRCSYILPQDALAGTWTVVMYGGTSPTVPDLNPCFGVLTSTFTVQPAVICIDECVPSGSRICHTSTSYKVCGNYDSDACLEWSSPINCQTGTTCSNGMCVPTAQCGNGVCDGNENCSTCPQDCKCPAGQICKDGVCRDACADKTCSDYCDGNILKTHGYCNSATGECVYQSQDCFPGICSVNRCINPQCPACPEPTTGPCVNGIQTWTVYECSAATNYKCVAKTETTSCVVNATCPSRPPAPCAAARWIDYPTCRWDSSACAQCVVSSDCKACDKICSGGICVVNPSYVRQPIPCSGAVWIDFPSCAWDTSGCTDWTPIVAIGLGAGALIIILFILRKKRVM